MPKGVYDHSSRKNSRESILEAAMKIYAFYGFEGATIERMAAAAGVSRSLIIQYFGSKQGLVMAIATRAVETNLAEMRRIDAIPGLTLRQRQNLMFEHIKPLREEWCLILGTLLVPNFYFDRRSEMENYLNESHRAVMKHHMDELRVPTRENAFAYAYSMISLSMGYILNARERQYKMALRHQQDAFLLPESDIVQNRPQAAPDIGDQ